MEQISRKDAATEGHRENRDIEKMATTLRAVEDTEGHRAHRDNWREGRCAVYTARISDTAA